MKNGLMFAFSLWVPFLFACAIAEPYVYSSELLGEVVTMGTGVCVLIVVVGSSLEAWRKYRSR